MSLLTQQGMTRQALKLLLYLSRSEQLTVVNMPTGQSHANSKYWRQALRIVKDQVEEAKRQDLFQYLLAHVFSSLTPSAEKAHQFLDLWAVLPKKMSPLSLLELFRQQCEDHPLDEATADGLEVEYERRREDLTLGILTHPGRETRIDEEAESAERSLQEERGQDLPLSLLKQQLLKMLGGDTS